MVEVRLKRAHWSDEALADFGRCESRNTRSVPIAEQLDGCALVEVEHAGRVVGRVALDRAGDVGYIVAAVGSLPGVWLSHLAPAVEALFGDVRAVEVETRRRGMVRQLARQGYRLTGFVMVKEMRDGRPIQ